MIRILHSLHLDVSTSEVHSWPNGFSPAPPPPPPPNTKYSVLSKAYSWTCHGTEKLRWQRGSYLLEDRLGHLWRFLWMSVLRGVGVGVWGGGGGWVLSTNFPPIIIADRWHGIGPRRNVEYCRIPTFTWRERCQRSKASDQGAPISDMTINVKGEARNRRKLYETEYRVHFQLPTH